MTELDFDINLKRSTVTQWTEMEKDWEIVTVCEDSPEGHMEYPLLPPELTEGTLTRILRDTARPELVLVGESTLYKEEEAGQSPEGAKRPAFLASTDDKPLPLYDVAEDNSGLRSGTTLESGDFVDDLYSLQPVTAEGHIEAFPEREVLGSPFFIWRMRWWRFPSSST